MDLCSGDIVTYTLSESPNLLMETTMLEQALKILPEKHDLILNSNQGWHYQHKQYRQILAERRYAEHELRGQLLRQCCHREFLRTT